MSHYADYITECGLLQIIEEPFGFVTFHEETGGCLWINEMFVSADARKSGNGRSLLQRVYAWGLERGCTYVATTVHPGSLCAAGTVAGLIRCGFRFKVSPNHLILMVKDLAEGAT